MGPPRLTARRVAPPHRPLPAPTYPQGASPSQRPRPPLEWRRPRSGLAPPRLGPPRVREGGRSLGGGARARLTRTALPMADGPGSPRRRARAPRASRNAAGRREGPSRIWALRKPGQSSSLRRAGRSRKATPEVQVSRTGKAESFPSPPRAGQTAASLHPLPKISPRGCLRGNGQ